MANRVMQAKALKLRKQRIKRRHLKKYAADVVSPRSKTRKVTAQDMKEYHGTIDGRDEDQIRRFGLDPKMPSETRRAVLDNLKQLLNGAQPFNYVELYKSKTLLAFMFWRIVHNDGVRGKQQELFIVEHYPEKRFFRRSTTYSDRAVLLQSNQLSMVAWEYSYKY